MAEPATRLVGGDVLDPAVGEVAAAGTVRWEGDRLAPGDSTDDRRIDVAGLTVLPGLIDAHTHLGAAYDLSNHGHAGTESAAEIAAKVFRNCELALDAGFTTCREMGGVDGGIVRAIATGLVRGPRILPSGPALAQDGGHGTFMPAWSECSCPVSIAGLVETSVVVNGADEARAAARRAFRRGATQLKAFISGGVVSLHDELDQTQLTVEELRAAVVEAEARNTYVTAHAHNNAAIRIGLDAGVACFEHGSWLDEETAAAMAASDAALVPTLATTQVMREDWQRWGLPELVLPRLELVADRMVEATAIARAAGVAVGAGSDLLGAEQDRRGLEVVLRARCEGVIAALRAVTVVNAGICRVADLGTLAPGSLADVIAVSGDPVAEPELFDDPSRIVLVVLGGRVVKDAEGRCG